MGQKLSQGAMRLRRWREKKSLTQTAFSRIVGTDSSYISQLERGLLPGRKLALAIERATDYTVSVESWDVVA